MTIRSHWTAEPWKYDPTYKLVVRERRLDKPPGLWYDVDGDWKRYCFNDYWNQEGFEHRYELILDLKQIMIVDSPEMFELFCDSYHPVKPEFRSALHPRWGEEISWTQLMKECAGVEIAPYFWKFRNDPKCNWYYTWDCASGCIWDYAAILDVHEIPAGEQAPPKQTWEDDCDDCCEVEIKPIRP